MATGLPGCPKALLHCQLFLGSSILGSNAQVIPKLLKPLCFPLLPCLVPVYMFEILT